MRSILSGVRQVRPGFDARTRLQVNAFRRDRQGNYWFGDEFGPYLIKTDTNGTVPAAIATIAEEATTGKTTEHSRARRAVSASRPRGQLGHFAGFFGDLRAASSAAAFSACFSARVLRGLGFLISLASCVSFLPFLSLAWG